MKIKNVVVIGSGTMGSGIAAHLCNANVPVTLLDLKTEISEKARERIHKSRPPLLIDKSKINPAYLKFLPSNTNPEDLRPSDIPSEQVLKQMGLSDSLVRISIGLDHDIERTYNTMMKCMRRANIFGH